MLELRLSTFDRHVDTNFQVIDNASIVCTLKLADIIKRTKTPEQEDFSLMFIGPLEPFIPQGTHKLKHEGLGELEIFLVPVGQSREGFQYEAIFNLLIRPT